MKTFSSTAAVIGLWLAVSFALWLAYRLVSLRRGTRKQELAEDALALIEEAEGVFRSLRNPPALRRSSLQDQEKIREDVRTLLNAIEANNGFFERVNAQKQRLQKACSLPDFLPLSEILQIRRDFWAASEVFLMEDLHLLGPEFAAGQDYETFRSEAKALLFADYKSGSGLESGQHDPVAIRLSIARDEAAAFLEEAGKVTAAEREETRLPSRSEIVAVPLRVIGAVGSVGREVRYLAGDAVITARSLARTLTSKGLKAAAEELRRTRGELPGQFATAFERAGGLARQGGDALKRHYEFLLETRELRARYAELLARAPELSERGKQFLARLELEKRADQFRETSGDAVTWSRQKCVVAIAYLIAGLQYAQAKVTPPGNKQLALRISDPQSVGETPPEARSNSEAEAPLRVLLLPASEYEGGNRGRRRSTRKKEERLNEQPSGLRDLIDVGADGSAGAFPEPKAVQQKITPLKPLYGVFSKPAAPIVEMAVHDDRDDDAVMTGLTREGVPPIPRKTSAAAGSLLERLAAIGAPRKDEASQEDAVFHGPARETHSDSRVPRFRLFKSKRS
jgi:hypothetical protein